MPKKVKQIEDNALNSKLVEKSSAELAIVTGLSIERARKWGADQHSAKVSVAVALLKVAGEILADDVVDQLGEELDECNRRSIAASLVFTAGACQQMAEQMHNAHGPRHAFKQN